MRPCTRLIAVALFLVLLFAIFELSGLRAHFNLAFLQQTIRNHLVSGLMIFVLVFALGNLVQIPGWVFLAAAVLTLGQMWGGVITYVAACISCVVTFFTIRFVGGDALRQLDGKIAVSLLSRLDAHPVKSILLLRMLFQTVPALNYTLAMSGVRFRAYLIGTLLGLPLPIAVYCVFFETLAKALKIV
ncbi:MAG: TVP38/TMEM64 family protein [Thiobacillus sp.]